MSYRKFFGLAHAVVPPNLACDAHSRRLEQLPTFGVFVFGPNEAAPFKIQIGAQDSILVKPEKKMCVEPRCFNRAARPLAIKGARS